MKKYNKMHVSTLLALAAVFLGVVAAVLSWLAQVNVLAPEQWAEVLQTGSKAVTFTIMVVLLITFLFTLFYGLLHLLRLNRLTPDRDDIDSAERSARGATEASHNVITSDLIRHAKAASAKEGLNIHVALSREARRIVDEIARHLSPLTMTTNLAPNLGLLGTLVGMACAFARLDGVAQGGDAAFKPVADALAIALITSVIGYLTKIFGMLLSNLINQKIVVIDQSLNYLSDRFLVEQAGSAGEEEAETPSPLDAEPAVVAAG